jgi:hypothetical protein
MAENLTLSFTILVALWQGISGGSGHDSIYVCGAHSKESVFARSLSESQLKTLYTDSMKLLASPDLQRKYRSRAGYPAIPDQFAYLNAKVIDTFSSDIEGVNSYVSFVLKGCMDESIRLSVSKDKIVLYYGLGGASDAGEETLWRADRKPAPK